jgi:AAA domain, putative AbiEii toxin, Type IV TA system
MRLQSIRYTENEGNTQEWVLNDLTLGAINLIVGKNSSGKTRTLNIISALSYFLMRLRPLSGSSSFDCQFERDGNVYKYLFNCVADNVVSEKLLISIRAEAMNNVDIQFQSPTHELAAASRRDSIQHSFLEPLFEWAASVRHYHFGSSLGKDRYTVFNATGQKVDDRDENAVVGIFRDGRRDYPDEFVNAVINDMANIDYHIESIDIIAPLSVRFFGVPGEAVGICVKERDLLGLTDQSSMSQGMYRVLSLLIHVNYFELKKTATCVLIDDIGEGLDFDRSCRLIELLRNKASRSEIQIVMSSNDRFIMNEVPLEEWSVLKRVGNHVSVKNHTNSRDKFEEFKFTGLSNFSFLEMDVINQPTATE